MAFKQEVNIPMVLTTGLISGMILIVLMLGTQAWFQSEEQAEGANKTGMGVPSEFVQLKAQQRSSLSDVGWADDAKTSVRIPIDQAMDMMVQTKGNLPSTQPAGK